MDYRIDSELAAGYYASRATFDFSPNRDAITAALNDGRFVVVTDRVAYCPHTDAAFNTPLTHMRGVYDTEADARRALGDHDDAQEIDDDYMGARILSPLGR